MVDPDVLKVVKTVVDENVPTGVVGVQMEDGSVQYMPVDTWQAGIKTAMANLAQTERTEAARKRARKADHRWERNNRKNGRQQGKR
jgi:hypothetical protein